MCSHRLLLPPQGDVDHAAGGVYFRQRMLAQRPPDYVVKKLSVIRTHDLPESTVDIPRDIRNSGLSYLSEIDASGSCIRQPWINILHGQIRISWDNRHRTRKFFRWSHFDLMHRVDDAVSVFHSFQNGMESLAGLLALQSEITVLHRSFHALVVRHAENIREAKIRPLFPVFVVKRSFISGHEAAS